MGEPESYLILAFGLFLAIPPIAEFYVEKPILALTMLAGVVVLIRWGLDTREAADE